MRIRILGQYIHVSIAALLLVEALICFLAPFAAARLWLGAAAAGSTLAEMTPAALAFSAAMLLGLTATGLYGFQQRARSIGIVARIAAAAALGAIALALTVYLFPSLEFGRGVLGVSMAIAVPGCILVRMLALHVFSSDVFRRRVLVYGAGRRAQSVTQLRRRTDRRGFVVAGFLPAGEAETLVPAEQIIHSDRSLYEEVIRHGVSEVVVAIDDRRRGFPTVDLLNCRLRGIRVIELVGFLERETGKVRVDMLNPSWLIFSDGFRTDAVRAAVERGFDLIVASGVVLLSLPLMLLAWLAIKLEDGITAPTIYAQSRVGLQGRLFPLFKFRSMSVDAERKGEAQWATPRDPRVTRVGRLLRRTRLDELPQLFNVLRGDMGFVGPRPERPEFVDVLSERIPYYRERHWVRPGITGWAQICYPYGGSERDAREKLQYDLYYVKHRSLLFDCLILVGTAEVVLWGKGAR